MSDKKFVDAFEWIEEVKKSFTTKEKIQYYWYYFWESISLIPVEVKIKINKLRKSHH